VSLRIPARFAPLALCVALFPVSLAFADEGETGESVEQKIKAQLEKIARLMKENEAALLEASRAGGAKPEGPDVKPPEDPPPPAMEGATPPEGGPPSGERGRDIRKRMEELLKTNQEKGGAIPKEIEELIKMIPMRKSESQDQPDDDPEKNQQGEARKPREQKPQDGKDPKDAKDPNKPDADKREQGKDKPPEGETGDPARNDLPPWIVGLPPEQQRMIMSGDTKDVPPEYRGLVERYLKWLNEHSGNK
jgi:hypothetical protein